RALNGNNIPYDVHYYLGVIYHSWADFARAEIAFKKFKEKATPKELQALNIDRLLEFCNNGKIIVQEQYDMEIISKTTANISKLNKVFPEEINKDNLLEKTAFFISPIDEKKKEQLWMFKTVQNEMIQTSYGLTESNGKDLFVNFLIGGDKWSIPKILGEYINTPYTEAYAYVTPDGKTLYFASEGHNSIGGLDIFKSTRN